MTVADEELRLLETKHTVLRSIARVPESQEEARLEATVQELRRRLAAIFEQPSPIEGLQIHE